jgi:flagellar M-ring protein FliF
MALLAFNTSRFNGAWNRYRQLLNGFTPGQKAVSTFALLAVVIGGIVLFTRASSPSYTTLFANLQENQAGQVTQKLNTDHVPYQLADGGTTVLVPQSDVNQERISLAESGLPAGGTITFQTLASTGITSSQFVQNVDYQQALEGQLANTIESIRGVQNAQVSLVIPNTDTFALSSTQTPSASVLLGLDPGTTLTSQQVQGVVHLIASSVPNLNAQNVTVVDGSGNVLSAPGVDTAANEDQQQTLSYDNTLAQSITAILNPVVGPNNAAVQVHAVLNFNQVNTQTNSFALGANGRPLTVPTSQSTTRQTFNGTGASAAGVLGAGQPANTVANPQGNYVSTQTQTQNSVGQSSQSVVQAPGQVIRTSVAVVLNRGARGARNLNQIRNMVAAAAGLNLRAGDTLVVTSLPFSPPAAARATVQSVLARISSYGPAIALVVVLIALFVIALRSSRRKGAAFEQLSLEATAKSLALPGALAGTPGAFAASARANAAFTGDALDPALDTGELAAVGPPTLTPNIIASLQAAVDPVPADVEVYIRENPEEVAGLMRHWSGERAAAR